MSQPQPPVTHRAVAGPLAALGSALLFGITTPLAKLLLQQADVLLIAGLLYLGSGVGLTALILVQDRGRMTLGLASAEKPWLAAAIVSGGVLAPALLMFGLARTDAASASLLLNLEAVFTALIAWLIFREATSARVVLGFLAILLGGAVLVWPASLGARPDTTSLMAIAGACACWALDNNFTRKVSGGDARALSAAKGLAAGLTNVTLALVLLHATFPTPAIGAATLLLGFVGYGVSLVLFILALRHLGTARTGAYFATAPFIGSALAIALHPQGIAWTFWAAAACMAVGVWLHLTESHEHEHMHVPLVHSHTHSHDAHHQHEHAPGWDGVEPHTHEHRHAPLRHRHAHYPDAHHQHSHG